MKERSSFGSTVGFVLAAAGSAVGLGNIWRFPYLAARDGGGVFLLVYIVLALTFGFTLLVTEVAIGRKTKQSQLTAYGILNRRFQWLGVVASLVPFLILPYYCVIGGWVLKYFTAFLTGAGKAAAEEGYFDGFIAQYISPITFDVIFLAATVFAIYRGVNKGIEKLSKILMPLLLVMIVGISIFALTVHGTGPDGVARTGLDGLKTYVVPDFSGMTIKKFLVVVVDAMGQLFYSISVAMGIMIAYGSYVDDKANMMKSVNQIEIFDTGVAFLAGVMIIPSVIVFMGKEGMENSGPGLMFEAMPRVFAKMGAAGQVVGAVFFLMVLFAALTSSMSVLEAVVSGLIDRFHWSRKKATLIEGGIALVFGVIVCLGYNLFFFNIKLPNGTEAQILDIADYVSNQIFMPVVAIGTCILIGWLVKPKTVIDEVTKNGEKFGRKSLYVVMIKFIAPVLLLFLLLISLGIVKL